MAKTSQRRFPDRTAADLRLAMALIFEEGGEQAHLAAEPYAVEALARAAGDLVVLASAVQVLQRWRDRLDEGD